MSLYLARLGSSHKQSTYGDFTQNDTTIRGKGPSPPSRDVIFLGLDPDLSESDVSSTTGSIADTSSWDIFDRSIAR